MTSRCDARVHHSFGFFVPLFGDYIFNSNLYFLTQRICLFSLFWSNRFLVSVYYREWWKHVRLHLCWECYSCPYMCWRSFRFSNGLCGRKGTPKLWIFLGVEFLFFSLSPSPVLVRCMKNEIFPCNPSVGIFHHQSWAYEVLGICISYIGKLGISKVKQASNFLTLTFTSWSFFLSRIAIYN